MSGVVIGVSFVATFASSNSYIGLAGKGYDYGAPWLLFALMIVIFTYVAWRFVAGPLRRFTEITNALTVPEFFEARFSSRAARILAGLIIVISSIFYLVAIFKGSSNLFQVFLDIPYRLSVLAMFIVVLLYTSVGGFVSVVRTDVWQGGLMVLGSLLLFYFITKATGGISSIVELIESPETNWLFSWNAGTAFLVLIGISLAGSMKLLIDPRQLSRFYGLRDERSVAVGIYWAIGGLLLIQFCLFPIGIYAHHLVVEVADSDLIVPTLVQRSDIFPVLIADFLVIAILSAAMSSMDSVLLVSGSAAVKDVVGQLFNLKPEHDVPFTRIGVVICAVVAALIALNPPGGIVELTIISGSLYAACFAPAVLLGLYWRRGNAAAALSSFAIGILTIVFWRSIGWNAHIHEVIPALSLSLVAYVVVSLSTDANRTENVAAFFDGEDHLVSQSTEETSKVAH